MDWMNLTGDYYEEHRKLNKDTSDPEWWYQVSRIFNIQASRTAWKSGPAFIKGHMDKMFRIETGMYKPKWITKWRAAKMEQATNWIYGTEENPGITDDIDILPEVKFRDKKKKQRKRRIRGDQEGVRRRALKSLALF
mgnify:CR=1 FL=1